MRKWAIFICIILAGCTIRGPKSSNLLPTPPVTSCISGKWPQACWWEEYQCPELNRLMVLALSSNPTIEKMRARIDFARNEAIIARSSLYPSIYFDADFAWTFLSKNGLYKALNPNLPRNVNLIDLTFNFSYDFDFWGKNRNLFYAALGRKRAQEAEEAQAELIVEASLAQAYFALKTNLVRRDLYRELFAVRKEISEMEVFLKDKALLSSLIPLLSEERLWEAQKWVEEIEKEIAYNRHLINILVGRGPDCEICIEEGLGALPEVLAAPCDLPIHLLARRPDLMAQIWRAEALSKETGAAAADFYPDISITAFLGLESVFYSRLFTPNSATTGVKPALSLPIFTAGAIAANVRGKRALFEAAVFEYNELLLQSVQEVADILSFASSVFAQKKEQDIILQKAAERFDLTLLLQNKGLENIITTLRRKEDLVERELDNIQLIYDQYVASIKLTKALGGGYLAKYCLQ